MFVVRKNGRFVGCITETPRTNDQSTKKESLTRLLPPPVLINTKQSLPFNVVSITSN